MIPQNEAKTALQLVIQAHAIRKGIFVGAVNRVVSEGEMSFYGSRFHVNPYGQIVDKVSSEEEVISAPVEMEMIEQNSNARHFIIY